MREHRKAKYDFALFSTGFYLIVRIAIVGAGAMGTLLAHGLCKAGYDVSILDRSARVEQIRSTGALLVAACDGTESVARPALVTDNYSEVGVSDLVILATKSHDLPAVAERLSELTSNSSIIVTIQNGIPWWFLQELPFKFGYSRIPCLDPDGQLERSVDSSQIVGCVAYPAAITEADGRVVHVEGYRFPVGELDGKIRNRTQLLVKLFEDAGFKSRAIDDIRSEIWLKAWGAIPINSISALTRATMVDICSFEPTRQLIKQAMRETQAIAEAFGARFRHTMDRRIEGAKAVGAHKTSMLQDVEAERSLELDGLMLAVLQLADMVKIDAPTIKNIYACTALLNELQLATKKQRQADNP